MWAWLILFCSASLWAQKAHELCAPCHAEQLTDLRTHPHFEKGVSCDACHGASVRHRDSTGTVAPDRVSAPDEVPALCGSCHAVAQKEYLASRHGRLVMERAKIKAANYTTCHGVHSLRKAAQMERQCRKCHEKLPQSCQVTVAPANSPSKLVCASCHARHTLVAKR